MTDWRSSDGLIRDGFQPLLPLNALETSVSDVEK
jgi:hypothetical protein